MADFNSEEARAKQNDTLDRVSKIYKSLQADVVDYYWDRAPQSADEAIENEKGIYKYLKFAYDDIDRILSEEDRDLS